MDTISVIRTALADHGRLTPDAAALPLDADLYAAGLSSHASINVMLAIEDGLGIEFPDELLTRSTFSSIANVVSALEGLA